MQAIFQAIHLSRIIECPILSTPGGVTSYHKPPVHLLIKRDGRFMLRRTVKKKGRCMDGKTGWTSAVFTPRGEESTVSCQIARCSLLTPGLRVSEEIHLASSQVPTDGSSRSFLTGFGVLRWGTKHEAHQANCLTDLHRKWSRVKSGVVRILQPQQLYPGQCRNPPPPLLF